jgi:hypothetical protein
VDKSDCVGADEARTRSPGSTGITIRRFSVAFIAIALFGVAVFVAWRAFGSPLQRDAASNPSGYFLLFPDEVTVTYGDANLIIQTNLPDGTRYEIRAEGLGPPATESEMQVCCEQLTGGQILFPFGCSNYSAPINGRSGFTIQVVVRPVWDDTLSGGGPIGQPRPPPPQQPEDVLAILGENFENVEGEQVVVDDEGTRQLVAEGLYVDAAFNCVGDSLLELAPKK